MLDSAWDFFLSFSARAIFVIALVAGIDWLLWTYGAWRTGYWRGEENFAHLSFVLAGITTLVGLAGAFRRGRAEANFEMIRFFSAVSSGSERTLRRFPLAESLILGSALIVLWAVVALRREELWTLRMGAIVGAVLITWGVVQHRVAQRAAALLPAATEPPPPPPA